MQEMFFKLATQKRKGRKAGFLVTSWVGFGDWSNVGVCVWLSFISTV